MSQKLSQTILAAAEEARTTSRSQSHPRPHRRNVLATLVAALLALASVIAIPSTAQAITYEVSVTATNVCNNGVAASATFYGAASTSYPVYYSFDYGSWVRGGNVVTGSLGIGSTITVYWTNASAGNHSVRFEINGVVGEAQTGTRCAVGGRFVVVPQAALS